MQEETVKENKPTNKSTALAVNAKIAKNINIYLDVITKLLPIFFAMFVMVGAVSIWIYLGNYGLQKEFSRVITSSQLLLQLSIFALIMSCLFLVGMLIGPLMYKNACNGLSSDKVFNIHTYLKDILIFIVTMGFQFVIALYWNREYTSLKLIIVPILASIVAFVLRTDQDKSKDFFVWLQFAMSLLLMLLPLMLLLLFASKVLANNIGSQFVFGIILALYAAIAAAFVWNAKNSLVLLVTFLILMSIVFNNQVIDFVIQKFGLSHYRATLAIEKKSCAIFTCNSSSMAKKKLYNSNADSLVYNDLWVIAEFPTAIIFSSSSSSKNYFILPNTAITGKFISMRK